MTRLQIYVAGSAVLANVVLLRAYYERPNFYSAAVYISQSTGSLMFLINLALIVTISIGYGLQRLFYGPLRAIETEQLYDKAWFAVSETLLAMTIFRDDIGIWFFAMFLCLLGGKLWQWIGEGRVEYLEQQPPANPKLFHIRLMSSLVVSVVFDLLMMQYCVDSILQQARPGVMVMFGFEYVLLAIASVSTLLRYVLSLVEIVIIQRQEKARQEARRVAREVAQRRSEAGENNEAAAAEEEDDDNDNDDGDVPGWEEKGRWVFYLDLTTDFVKSVVYIGFFVILMAFYGIPIHIMRDLFMTLRSFFKRVNDFIQYRNATRDMNARYPDATAEELERENTCIVCREEMRQWVQPGAAGGQPGHRVDERQRPKKLPCGHILHFGCLRSWLERQQVCPTCRRPVLSTATQNNQTNQAQQNQQNPPQFRGVAQFRNEPHNQAQQAPYGAAGAQPGQYQGNQQAGQQNRAAGNMRVYNFGPIRIALGRLPNPPGDINNMNQNNAMANLAQQIAQNRNQVLNQLPNRPLTPPLTMGLPTLPGGVEGQPTLASLPHHPADIQSDILRLQQNIIDSLRLLNNQHNQLEYVHALLAELHRLQQASGVASTNGQELPIIAPLNAPFLAPIVPQAYFSSGPVLRQGDAGIPDGLVLPEGWTLRPLAPASSMPNRPAVSVSTSPPPTSNSAQTEPSSGSTSQARADGSDPRPSSTGGAARPASAEAASSKQGEPSSLESSWSFGNVAEGSSSAVASGSTENRSMTRRTATVEDDEDDGR